MKWLSPRPRDPCNSSTRRREITSVRPTLQGLAALQPSPTAGRFLSRFGVVPVEHSSIRRTPRWPVQTGRARTAWPGRASPRTTPSAGRTWTGHFLDRKQHLGAPGIGSFFVNQESAGPSICPDHLKAARTCRRSTRGHTYRNQVVLGRRGRGCAATGRQRLAFCPPCRPKNGPRSRTPPRSFWNRDRRGGRGCTRRSSRSSASQRGPSPGGTAPTRSISGCEIETEGRPRRGAAPPPDDGACHALESLTLELCREAAAGEIDTVLVRVVDAGPA